MNLITRADWGAAAPHATTAIGPGVSGIAIHWEGPTLGSFPHSDCFNKVRTIQHNHMSGANSDHYPWNDIAYSYVVCPHGFIFEGRGVGIRSAAQGTNDGNAHYYAVCYLAGVGDPFTAEAKTAYLNIIAFLRASGAGQEVHPHSFFHSTQCPGDDIRNWLNAGMPASNVAPVVMPAQPAPQTAPAPAPAPRPVGYPSWPGRNFRLTSPLTHDNAIAIWQQQMKNRGWNIGVDGWFGNQSNTVLRQFQAEKHLSADGILGPTSWAAAWTAPR